MTESKYFSLGVSASKSGLHSALIDAGLDSRSDLFASVSSDIAGNNDYHSFVHCDGAGTKALAAYLVYKDTRDLNAFSGLSQDALVMNLDDVFCIGAPDSLLLGNTIARNARLVPDEAVGTLVKSYKLLVEKLCGLGVPLEMAGGETADCGDIVRTLVVDAVLSGRIKKSNLIHTERIVPGDVIVGLSSTGRATYEEENNSGIGSNGLTLARHALLSQYYLKNFAEAFDPDSDSKAVYQGPFRTTDTPQQLGMNIGQALISPTRTYTPIMVKLFQTLGTKIHGVIHNTGGALTKVLRFGAKGNCYVKDNLFSSPAIFSLVQQYAQVDWSEMYQVFNMGQRLEIYLEEQNANTVIDTAKQFGVEAQIIGHVEKNSSEVTTVKIISTHGEFDYSLEG